jgi:hypothetical protein
MSATITAQPVVIDEAAGVVRSNPEHPPTAAIELNLEQLRLVAKSLSKTRDAETKKLGRLAPASRIHADVKADWLTIDGVLVEIEGALTDLVNAA